MLEKLTFYTRHSINDLRVNGQRTLFALLCIAAGVAAIVSLQTLGVMIQDTLTGSIQESNRGDIRLSPNPDSDVSETVKQRGVDEGVVTEGSLFSAQTFSLTGIGTIKTWFSSNYPGTEITYRQAVSDASAGLSINIPDRDSSKTFVVPYIIDAKVYPFYGTRKTEDGQLLSDLLQGPNDIVISRNLADDLGAQVGDTVSLSGAAQTFTLRGIVATSEESGFENIQGSLFGYYYIDLSAVSLFDKLKLGADTIYVKLPPTADVRAVKDRFEQRYPYLTDTTTDDLKKQNSQISDAVTQLVTVMGLVSLLIGGIGIVNTMLVIVSRRTTEVAVLKTIGLEAEQVTVLFLVEAVLMGMLGSILGILLGWVAAFAIKGVAENFLAQTLTFRVTLAPPLTGFVVGVLVTTIFGFLPTLAAGQVRPNLVLRPSDTVVPKAGRARSFAALLFVMLAISLVAQPLIGNLLSDTTVRAAASGVGGLLGLLMGLTMLAGGLFSGWTHHTLWRRILRWLLMVPGLPLLGSLFGMAVPALLILFGSFITVGVLYVVLWVLIWLVGRFFPTWRLVDLRIALRSMLAAKGRNASTLLALVIGVFTLSLITMLAGTITQRFEQLLQNEVGGNVIVFAAGQSGTLDKVNSVLDSVPGVESYSSVGTYDTTFKTITDPATGQTMTIDDLKARAEQVGGSQRNGEEGDSLSWSLNGIDARGVDSNLPDVTFYAGRQLTPEDVGPWDPANGHYPPIVISAYQETIDAGIKVGDLITYELSGGTNAATGVIAGAQPKQTITFEIVGMVDRTGNQISVNFGSANYAPTNAFPEGMSPDAVSAIVQVNEANIRDLRQQMNQIPGVFVLETKMLNDLLNSVIKQFTSFPILVAALSLIVGGIVIANSVALSTLERRREIAVMKAVGLQRERVLGMLLLEYGLMGVIGGLIGVGLGGIGLLYMLVKSFGGEMGRSIPYVTAFELMALCVGIALVAAILTAWNASGEKPLNVLRYE
jgi:putative ABC transport system permease protein